MRREDLLAQMNAMRGEWDFLVIGGGASGLGTALDSTTRGYRTLLLERGDFAEGTSSRSTKLIHGGVRYLRQGHWQLVRKALVERARLLCNAPHLVHSCPFLIPADHRLKLWYYQTGLKLYEKLAGKRLIQPSYTLAGDQMRMRLPNVLPQAGGVVYFDAQFDDARLAVNLAQTIVDHGGVALNYLQVEQLLKHRGKVVGVVATDRETGRQYELRARVVVNATGAFSDQIRQMDEPLAAASLTFSQGAHLVLPRAFFPSDCALVIPRTRDGRVLFLIPWHDRVLVGTTETVIEQPDREPRVRPQEIAYLLETVSRYLIHAPKESDMLGCFAGIRPLVKSTRCCLSSSWISRDHRVMVSPAGLVSVIGGKWTTYRQMAQDTVDMAAKAAELSVRPCRTADLRIHGWQAPEAVIGSYGADTMHVEEMAKEQLDLREQLHPNLPCRGIDVMWAVRKEMARTVEDVLIRRTCSFFLGAKDTVLIVPRVAEIMARELGYDAIWEQCEIERFFKKMSI